jgi:hypothetical protein
LPIYDTARGSSAEARLPQGSFIATTWVHAPSPPPLEYVERPSRVGASRWYTCAQE